MQVEGCSLGLFVDFCVAMEEKNGGVFELPKLVVSGEEDAQYSLTYRDEHNFKWPMLLHWKGDLIRWDAPTDEADDEAIEALRSVKLQHNPFFCPFCGGRAVFETGDRYHLDEERFEDTNDFLYEGRIYRYSCTICDSDFYLPEDNS